MATIGCLLMIIGMIGAISVTIVYIAGFVESSFPLLWYCIAAIALGRLLANKYIKEGRERKEKEKADYEERAALRKEIVELTQKVNERKPKITAKTGLEYHYDDVRLALPRRVEFFDDYDMIDEGDPVEIEKEPDNEYDEKAVMVTLGGNKIGYIYRGKLQDMINDFIDRGDDIEAEISRAGKLGVFINITLFKEDRQSIAEHNNSEKQSGK